MLDTRPPMTAGPIERALSAVGSTTAAESTDPAVAGGVGFPSSVFFFVVCWASERARESDEEDDDGHNGRARAQAHRDSGKRGLYVMSAAS